MKPIPSAIIIITIVALYSLIALVSCEGAEIDISKIIQIESSGNPNAYNKSSGAIGLMQITPVCLEDWNTFKSGKMYGEIARCNKNDCENYTLFEYYNLGDLYNPTINVKIGTWYINERIPQMLEAFDIPDTVENRLIAYNFGVGNLRKYLEGEKKLPKETKNYILKYKRLNQ